MSPARNFSTPRPKRHYLRAMQTTRVTPMCAKITPNCSTRSVAWRIRWCRPPVGEARSVFYRRMGAAARRRNATTGATSVEELVRRMRAITPTHRPARITRVRDRPRTGRRGAGRARGNRHTLAKGSRLCANVAAGGAGQIRSRPSQTACGNCGRAPGEASNYFIARQDVDGYNAYIELWERYPAVPYFPNLYSSTSAGHAMLRDPRVKAMIVRYGLPAYWREKGWPAGCHRLGETDFECGLDAASE